MRSVARFAWALFIVATLAAFGGVRVPEGRSPAHRADGHPMLSAADAQDEPANDAREADNADEDGNDSDNEDVSDAPADPDDDDAVTVDDAADSVEDMAAGADAGHRHKAKRGGCPSSMVRVKDFCMDRYEAPNRRGAKPLVMQSANDAVAWCATRNKRLCTEDEWIDTCEGDEHRTYPYGEEHVDGRCNDDKPWKKVDEAVLAKWPAAAAHAHAKELYQATPSGWKHKCVSEDGVRDLTGNVEEWVSRTRDHDNDWPYILIGCYWSGCFGGNKPTCRSTNDAHGPEFRFYETGFRCCRDAAKAK